MKLRESLFTRRAFLNGNLAAAIGGLCATVFGPIARFVWPSRPEPLPDLVVVPKADVTLRPGEGKIVSFGRCPALVIRMASGELRAFLAVCTHLNCTVGYRPKERDIHCACHLGRFDLDGNVLEGPPPRPLTRFVIEQRGENLVIAQQGVNIDGALETTGQLGA